MAIAAARMMMVFMFWVLDGLYVVKCAVVYDNEHFL